MPIGPPLPLCKSRKLISMQSISIFKNSSSCVQVYEKLNNSIVSCFVEGGEAVFIFPAALSSFCWPFVCLQGDVLGEQLDPLDLADLLAYISAGGFWENLLGGCFDVASRFSSRIQFFSPQTRRWRTEKDKINRRPTLVTPNILTQIFEILANLFFRRIPSSQ